MTSIHPAYEDLSSLFQPHPEHPQLGFIPIEKNPKNGQEIPFFKAQSPEERKKAFLEMPEHLQKQIAKIEQLQKEQFSVMQNPTHVPASSPMPHTFSASPKPEVLKKVGEATTHLKKPKPQSPKFDHIFFFQGRSLHLKPAYSSPNENGIRSPIQLKQQEWDSLESLYKKYLKQSELFDPSFVIEDLFFYRSTLSEELFFEMRYHKDGVIQKKVTLVDGCDLDAINALKTIYEPLLRQEPKQREFRRLAYSSKELQEKLSVYSQSMAPSESPILSLKHNKAFEEAQKQALSYSATLSYPLLANEMTQENQNALIHRPIKLSQSQIKFVEASQRVHSMTDSQYFFSESPYQVRSFYSVSPRSGNHPSDLDHPQTALLAQTQPLHFCLNAKAGTLWGKQAIDLQDHPSLVIFSKHETLGYQFASIIQKELLVPQLDESDEKNCLSILEAILEQATKYHEVRIGFKKSPLKIREPIVSEDVFEKRLDDQKLKTMRLSVFIRSMAMLLVNSNEHIKAPEVQLEFEYEPPDQKQDLPDYVIGLINQQNALFRFIETQKNNPVSSLNIQDLVAIFYSKLLNQFFFAEELEKTDDFDDQSEEIGKDPTPSLTRKKEPSPLVASLLEENPFAYDDQGMFEL